jgi:hypothetical protein
VRKVQFSDPDITATLDLAKRYDDKFYGLDREIWCSPLRTAPGEICGGTRGV